ncbi:FadR/GntR family transcriptional regulator [Speluncibacter jeojiensis]|uniref:FCD domain-containing protein n=1 Tax=Speluncibacter jeojiensis TaxID=2710754 RepID=A0A9X4RFP9_9ACTN|nr:FCD domain-containing protein [Corynebacteriales bacterium D3-21]
MPLSERAAQELMGEIESGRWEVGDQLPGELALAAELNVGRSTIREAIRQLAARRVLTTRQGVGVFLAATRASEGWDRLAEIAAITEVVQVRVAIESRAAALAAVRHEEADADLIRRALTARNALLGAPSAELAAADIEFHGVLVAASRNSLLDALFTGVRRRLVEAMTELLDLMPATEQDADEHQAVVDAILARDADRAEALTRAHLLGLATSLQSGAGQRS